MSKKRSLKRLDSLFSELAQQANDHLGLESAPDPSLQAQQTTAPDPSIPATADKDIKPYLTKPVMLRLDHGKPLGYRAEEDLIQPAESELTSLGIESIKYQHLLYQHARGEDPAILAVPAAYDSGAANILLEVQDEDQLRHWTEDELELIEQVADQLTVALENAQLFKQTQIQAEELNLLRQISLELAQEQQDLNVVLEIISKRARELLNSDASAIWIWHEHEKELVQTSIYPSLPAGIPAGRCSINDGLPGLAFANRKSQIIDNYPAWSAQVNHPASKSIYSVMAVPLVWQAQGIGVLEVSRSQRDFHYTSNDRHLAELLAVQAASVIQNAHLFERTQAALQETETLYKASAELNSSEAYEDILNILKKYTILGENSQEISINLYDRHWAGSDMPDWFDQIASWSAIQSSDRSNANHSGTRYSMSSIPAASQLLHATEPTIITDVTSDMRLGAAVREIYLNKHKTRSLVFTPLVIGGKWIGHVCAYYHQPTQFSDPMIRRLNVLTSQAAVAIQNLRLLEETRRRADEMQTAAEIARDSTGTLALDDLLRRAVELIRERFIYYHVTIYLLDELAEFAVIHASTINAGAAMKQPHKLAVGLGSVIGHVIQTGEALVVNDISQYPIYQAHPLLPEAQAELGIPLKIGESIIGVLDVHSIKVNAFTTADISVLQILADQLAIAVENAKAYKLSLEAVDEMRQADQLKSQFLANMSHELRTPLNSIIGFSRVILKGIDGPITDVQEQDLNAIYNSGQHLLNLINDILDLSKIEAGKMELSFEDNVNLVDVINSVMPTATGLVKDKPIELLQEIEPDLLPVHADPVKIRQVLLNLLSNAAKFTDAGTILIRAAKTPDFHLNPEIQISVTDTGTGISPEDQSKLFLPFSQVDASPSRKTGGSGLGLSICRHLIEMHGGQIGVDSVLGQGSTFYFTLPVVIPQGITHPKMDAESSKSILCIDSEREVINLYKQYLTNHGYQVIPLSEQDSAIAVASRLLPLAITLDLAMEHLDGWQLLQSFKENPSTKHIPVIICSVLDEREKALALGADDYLLKPVLEDELVTAIKTADNHPSPGG